MEDEQRLRDIQRAYLDFLDDEEDQRVYQQRVRDMISDNEVRLLVNINDLRRKNPERASALLNSSFDELVAFQRALKDFVSSIDAVYGKQYEEFHVGFEGSFGARHVTPRSLSSRHLSNMVCVEGIVTKCSLVRPKVVKSVHYCPATKKTIDRKYTDMTSLDPFPSGGVYPTKDEDGNLLETEFGLSTYKDHQTFTIQEMPEKAPAGQLPRAVDIVVDNDLVDKCKPGDRIQVIGMYRVLPGKKNGYTNGTFRTLIIANNISLMSKEITPHFTADDIAKIKKFSKQKINVFDTLSKSLAPSIHGHEFIKKAVLCMLLGGTERVLDNGSRIRGDINVLLIGDPSVAKSQMLRYVLATAPRAIATTGRGSSGVGLTAAVTSDEETGERRLEAGAMVLADRGVVCIDEFDKMSDMDRTAIHEVMEQGRVTIAKAGIHAKLNARCSVLAAANPVYGRYDQFKTPMENIGLQDSLLSRFDLLFVILDTIDPEMDRMISDFVLRIHRYRSPTEQDGDALPFGGSVDVLATRNPDLQEDEETETPIYEKFERLLHGDNRKAKNERVISTKFMRKYIHVAKDMKPALTREAADYIAEEYSKLRSQDLLQGENIARTQPVTARSLETIIRISVAHAKSRLSKTVDIEDAEAAVDLVQFAYFKKVLKKEKRKRKHGSDEESEEEEETNDEPSETVKSTPSKSKGPKKNADGVDPFEFDEEMDADVSATTSQPSLQEKRDSRKGQKDKSLKEGISDERLSVFKTGLHAIFQKEHSQSVQVEKLKEHLNSTSPSDVFENDEIYAAIDIMMDDNKLMLSDDMVFLI